MGEAWLSSRPKAMVLLNQATLDRHGELDKAKAVAVPPMVPAKMNPHGEIIVFIWRNHIFGGAAFMEWLPVVCVFALWSMSKLQAVPYP